MHVGLGFDTSGALLEVSASEGTVLGLLTIELDRVATRGHLATTEEAANLGIAHDYHATSSRPRGTGLQVAAGPVLLHRSTNCEVTVEVALEVAYYRSIEREDGAVCAAIEREAHRGLLGALGIDAERIRIGGVLHARVG